MINFLAGGNIQTHIVKRAKIFLAVLTGCTAGIMWGKLEWSQREDWCNSKSLTEYECEDQINSIVEKTRKPAVIYYYLPMKAYHYLFRSYMLKYSNKYP